MSLFGRILGWKEGELGIGAVFGVFAAAVLFSAPACFLFFPELPEFKAGEEPEKELRDTSRISCLTVTSSLIGVMVLQPRRYKLSYMDVRLAMQ